MASFCDESVCSGHGRLNDPTHPHSSKLRLLPEIISHVISFVIPNDGLTISNEPDRNSDFDTIISLLKTSIKIKDETLRQIYRQPLYLVITSGQDCTCRRIPGWSPDPHIFEFPLLRAITLPLGNWPILHIHFAPGSRCSRISRLSYPSHRQVHAAYCCIRSQSETLATWLRKYAVDANVTTLKTAFTFAEVWVDSTDNTQQRQFLYSLWTVVDFMSPWKWTAATPEALTDQIKFPHMLFTGYSRDDVPDDHEAAGSRGIIEDLERQFSAWWSPRSQQVIPILSLDMGRYYLLGWSYTPYRAMFADELSDGTGLLYIKITPDMTEGDNSLGIWEPAMLRE